MRGYLAILGLTAILAIVCCIVANVVADPFRILHSAVGIFSFQPNDRVAKAAFLSRNCTAYSGYIMGDSRSEILNGSDLGTNGERFYNYSVPRDGIEGILRRVEFLTRRSCPLSTLLVGESIDVLSDETDENLLMTDSPLVSGENQLSFYAKFFFNSQTLVSYVRDRWPHRVSHYIYYPDGHVDYLLELRSPSDLSRPNCGAVQSVVMQKQSMVRKLSAYRMLAELSSRNHFRVILWITPFNKLKSALFDEPVAQEYLTQLRAIPNLSVVEADRDSPLLSDYTAWYDCMHFRHVVFDQLISPAVSQLISER
jgi:hypothetical protein